MQKHMGLAAFSMAIAIFLGALGAHALSEILSANAQLSYKTAVTYQVWHSLAILLICLSVNKFLTLHQARLSCLLFFGGILFFSGSLYLLSLRYVLGIEQWVGIIGPVTPIGGLLFICGWIYSGICIFRSIRHLPNI